MSSRRTPAALTSAALAAFVPSALATGLLLGLGACAGAPVAGLKAPAAGLEPACERAFGEGLDERDLGFSLAGISPQVPRALEALAAFVTERGRDAESEVSVEASAGNEPIDLEGLVGRARCGGLDRSKLVARGTPLRLVSIRPSAVAEESAARGQKFLSQGLGAEARLAFATAAAHDPWLVPERALAIAESYEVERRWDQAVAFYREATVAFGWNDEAFAGLGRAVRGSGRAQDAIASWVRVEAMRPQLDVVRAAIGEDPFVELRAAVLPPATRLGVGRWRAVRTTDTAAIVDEVKREARAELVLAEASAYAGCKEAFRGSAALRRAALGVEMPVWRWSPGEESVCTVLWLRAYVSDRERGRLVDGGLEELAEIAREGLLEERAIHDVGAGVHGLMTALMGGERRERVVTFVERHRVIRRQGGWLVP